MKRPFSILLLVALSCPAPGQDQYQAQRTSFMLYSVGIGGLSGGVGAWVNKEKEQKWHQVLLKGVAQGALGGLAMHQGKNMTYQIYAKRRYGRAWSAHIVHAAGASIAQNAATNHNFWEHWHINLWLFRLDYDLPEHRFRTRLSPSSLYGYLSMRGEGTLNLAKSMKTGVIYLDDKGTISYEGMASATTIAIGVNEPYYPESRKYEITAHEMVHVLQYESFVYINPLLHKVDTRWKSNAPWYSMLSNFIYFDFNGLYGWAMYDWVEGGMTNPCYWDNFLEKEAEHYSHRKYVDCQ